MRIRAALFSGLLAVGGPGLAAADLPGDVTRKLDEVFAKWDSTASPGCALGVSRDGALAYSRAYGMANFEHDVAITPGSIFHVASISKQFTGFAIALLAKDGKLSLDDPVLKHIPELPDYGHPITIRHLLQHTSGLRDQWELLDMAGWREDDLVTQDDVLRIVTRQRSLNFEPGTEYVYSNSGFTLAAIIVKRVAGESLRDYAAARIFGPLGMNSTHFHDDHTMIVRGRTSAYKPRPEGGWRISLPVFDTYGATSLFSTVSDLLAWEHNLVAPRVGDPEVVEEMLKPARLKNGETSPYGLGIAVGQYRGVRTVGHAGADAGYRADFLSFPDQKLAIAALCNLSNITPSALTQQVAEVLLPAGVLAPLAPVVAVPPAELEAVAGTYWNQLTDDARQLSVKDGVLSAGWLTLEPVGGGRFRPTGQTGEWQFAPAQGDRPVELRVDRSPRSPAVFRRLAAPAPPASWTDYEGRYESDEIGAVYNVAGSATGLVLARPKNDDVALSLIAPDTFYADGWTVTFTRKSRSVDGFAVSNGRIRRLRFTKVRS
jgi:CubicO group peptidase (beta-lactamase class C family)